MPKQSGLDLILDQLLGGKTGNHFPTSINRGKGVNLLTVQSEKEETLS